MLPSWLGARTTLVTLDFQTLEGHSHRAHPHLWLAKELAQKRPGLGPPPTESAWTATLDWLQRMEPSLGDTRVLVAIDEVEGLQRGIKDGWATPAFLDFVRAAGNSLERIRLLLTCARPLHRLGRTWTDRLISVIQLEISYLKPEEAADLARNPMPGFPDIYPPGGVERIIRETNAHPYLLQLVCDTLIGNLNKQGRLRAEDADITRAFDGALPRQTVFRELWQAFTDEERAWLRKLAEPGEWAVEPDAVLKELRQQGYVEEQAGRYTLAVPLFRTWIRGNA